MPPLPPRWLRRLVVEPLWLVLGLLLLVIGALVTVLGLLVWPITPRRRVPRFAALATGYIALDLALMLACAGLWCRHPIARRRDPARWVAAHAAVLRWALNRLVTVAARTVDFHLDIRHDGLPLDRAEPVVLLARHAGPGDSFTLVWLILERYRRCPRVVLKDALQWDPGLDVILNRLDSCFLPSHNGSGDDATGRIARATRALLPGDALLIFPEGGNWTPRRLRRAVLRLRRSGHPGAARRAASHPHVLPPRPAGTEACLQARPDLDVVVVAHCGLDELVSVGTIWAALPLVDRPMIVDAWRVPAEQVPRDETGIEQWLDDQWTRIETWIEQQQALA